MLHCARSKYDGPVGIVVANWSWDQEAPRQLRIDLDLCAGIQLPNEVAFDPRIRDAIVENVILDTLEKKKKILTNLGGGKDIGVISLVDRIIDQLLDKVTCLLLLDQPRCLRDEVLRVCAILFED